MSRSIPWRRSCPDLVKEKVEKALQARFYVLRETGPTGFLVKEESKDAALKVFLGDPNSCTCHGFLKEKDLCIHILWVLLKRFRLSRENALIYQKALVEREISEIIHGIHIQVGIKVKSDADAKTGNLQEILKAKTIYDGDVCPICHEELLNCKEPLTHCRYGCGNNIHIKCMKIWAQHRNSDGEKEVKCPLCRGHFGTYCDIIQEFNKLLAKQRVRLKTDDSHPGASCQNCKMSPIKGKCYRCVVCWDYQLCHICFENQIHQQHSFHFRKIKCLASSKCERSCSLKQNTNQRWRPALRTITSDNMLSVTNSSNTHHTNQNCLPLSSEKGNESLFAVKALALEKRSNSDVVKPHADCQICNRTVSASQWIRKLTCSHMFHRECLDNWIARGHSTCPVDGERIRAGSQSRHCEKESKDEQTSRRSTTIDLTILGTGAQNVTSSIPPKLSKKMNKKPSCSTASSASQSRANIGELDKDNTPIRRTAMITGNGSVIQRIDREVRKGDLIMKRHIRRETLPPLHPRSSQSRRRITTNESDDSTVDLNSDILRIGSVLSWAKLKKA